jgi:gluconokinase
MSTFPVSPYVQVGGLVYFARMISKIRLHASGELPDAFHENLGIALDARCCSHLGVAYPALRARVLAGGTDEEIFAWCQQTGRALTEHDLLIWNGFAPKRGWRDDASPGLARHKAAAGLAHRDDLDTFFAFFEVDEGRAPR